MLSQIRGMLAIILIVVLFILSLFLGAVPYARKIAWGLIVLIAAIAGYNAFKS